MPPGVWGKHKQLGWGLVQSGELGISLSVHHRALGFHPCWDHVSIMAPLWSLSSLYNLEVTALPHAAAVNTRHSAQ
jgi:hypothetical protein